MDNYVKKYKQIYIDNTATDKKQKLPRSMARIWGQPELKARPTSVKKIYHSIISSQKQQRKFTVCSNSLQNQAITLN